MTDPNFPNPPDHPGQIVLADKLTPFTDLELAGGMVEAYRFVFGEDIERRQLCALAAQVILETGHGQYCHNFEIGNKKASPSFQGFVQFFRCNEVEHGKLVWYDPYNPACCFRGWDKLPKGIEAQLRFLGLATRGAGKPNRYAKAWDAAKRGDWIAFGDELGLAGYYTASRALYIKGLTQLATHLNATLPTVFDAPAHEHDPVVMQPTSGHSRFSDADLNRILSLQLPLTIDWDAFRADRDAFLRDREES
jgi:hypothetical protein